MFSITHIESISNLLKPYFYSISGIEPTQRGGGGSNASSIFICLTDAFLGIIRAIFSKVLFIPQQVKIEKKVWEESPFFLILLIGIQFSHWVKMRERKKVLTFKCLFSFLFGILLFVGFFSLTFKVFT